MVLQGRSLPVFNHSQPIENRNLTMLDSYTFIESSPYEDSYYYLMIVSDSIIEVNVKVVTFGNFIIFIFNYIYFQLYNLYEIYISFSLYFVLQNAQSE